MFICSFIHETFIKQLLFIFQHIAQQRRNQAKLSHGPCPLFQKGIRARREWRLEVRRLADGFRQNLGKDYGADVL